MDICETELRKEIAKVPDGVFGPETDWLDDDGVDLAKPHRISASLEVKGDRLRFILDSDAQARGPINLRPCVSRNFIECLVKMIFIPALPVNDGLSRPVRGRLSAGGFVAQSALSGAGQHVCAAEPGHDLGRDAHARQGRARPGAGARQRRRRFALQRRPPSAVGPLVFAIRNPQRWRRRASRRRWRQRHGRAGGQRDEHAGRGGGERVSRARRALRAGPDSAGAGTFRGGLGSRRDWRVLGEESIVNLRSDRFKHASAGAVRCQAGASLEGDAQSRPRR